MQPPYRVQEYILDMGVYRKNAIINDVEHRDYCEKNVYMKHFYVILPPDDWYGETLPQVIRTQRERTELIRSHE